MFIRLMNINLIFLNLVLFDAHEKRGVADNMDESEEIFPEAAVEAAGLSSIKNLFNFILVAIDNWGWINELVLPSSCKLLCADADY